MKNFKALIFICFLTCNISIRAQKTLHDFKAQTLAGSEFNMASLKGKKVLIVNTASKCGLTPQYEQLESLYKKYKDKNFIIIGFPANNFLWQEPGTNEEIANFCKSNYGVTFPMMAKISVKGKNMDPIYKWLTQKSENGLIETSVKWNFQKFMVAPNGNLVDVVYPKESPFCDKIIKWIEEN